MNSIRHNAKKLIAAIFLLVTCSSLLVACGGSDSDTTAGIGGTGIVSGKITGFGSIHVNGGKFEIDNSLFDVDGDTSADQSDLALGMVVRLRVETEDGILGNTALEVVYDDEIEGPITGILTRGLTIKTGTVFGQTITFDKAKTQFVGTSFDNIGNEDGPPQDVIEVSGFRVSSDQITATYVRFKEDLDPGNTKVELRGLIKFLAGTPLNETFMIDNIVITTDISTELEVPNDMLVEDIYVEVEGVILSPITVLAKEIEFEDEDFDGDVDDISLEGIVWGFSGDINDDFFIQSQRVNASTAQFSPAGLTLADDLIIEVEGPIIDSVLIADEVEKE
jgi:hypothetical protein